MKIYTYDNKIMTVGGKWMEQPEPTLPPFTIRLKFAEGFTPAFSKGTGVQVSSSPNIWDLTYNSPSWYTLCRDQINLVEVIGANTTGVTSMSTMFRGCTKLTTVSLSDTSSVTNMSNMFNGCARLTTVSLFDTSSVSNTSNMFTDCSSLTTVPLFNTSNVTNMNSMFARCTVLTTVPQFNTSIVTNMSGMFRGCTSLTSVPLFDTSSVTSMNSMFYDCTNVQSGALALYQQASTQATPPTNHSDTFTNCGSNTTTGAAELDEIPEDWGGTMSDNTGEIG